MMFERRRYRYYDHRLKQLIVNSNNPNLFPGLQIPRSTAMQWIKNGPPEVVTLPEFDVSNDEPLIANSKLKDQVDALEATNSLVLTTFRIFGFQIQYKRLPNATSKETFLTALEKAKKVLPLKTCLMAIDLSFARYYAWTKKKVICLLEDKRSCPKLSPTRIRYGEIVKMKEWLIDKSLLHYSLFALSWRAKKEKAVYASPSSWASVMKMFDISRLRKRIYPPRRRVGIRATRPFEILHLDLTIIKLNNDSKVYIQAVLDNFSRYVLAWSVDLEYGGIYTKTLLLRAFDKAKQLGMRDIPDVFVDGGSENDNGDVNSLITANLMKRTIARLEIDYSNSMIEALFLRLKNAYLYLQQLTCLGVLKESVYFYLNESNDMIPHSALKGATPFEAITRKWTDTDIATIAEEARKVQSARLTANRSAKCQICPC
jgi:putative transposase